MFCPTIHLSADPTRDISLEEKQEKDRNSDENTLGENTRNQDCENDEDEWIVVKHRKRSKGHVRRDDRSQKHNHLVMDNNTDVTKRVSESR